MLDKLSKNLIKPVRMVVFLVVIAMVMLVVIQIFCRFVLNVSVPWTEEMARLFFVWMIFLGSAVTEAEGGQISTTVFFDKLSRIPRFILGTAIYCIEIIFNLCLFIGCVMSWDTVKVMTFSTVTALNYRLLYVPLLIGAPFMIFYLVQNIQFCQDLFHKEGGSE